MSNPGWVKNPDLIPTPLPDGTPLPQARLKNQPGSELFDIEPSVAVETYRSRTRLAAREVARLVDNSDLAAGLNSSDPVIVQATETQLLSQELVAAALRAEQDAGPSSPTRPMDAEPGSSTNRDATPQQPNLGQSSGHSTSDGIGGVAG